MKTTLYFSPCCRQLSLGYLLQAPADSLKEVLRPMADLNTVATSLQQMRQRLVPLMDALISGAPEEVQERNLRIQELERIRANLRVIVRDLQSEQHRLWAMQRNLGKISRDQRWPANQSLGQQQKNLQNAKKQAEDLAEAVRQLMDKNGLLSGLQMSLKVNALIENLEKTADQGHAIHQIMSELGVPSIGMLPTEPASFSALIPTLVFVIYGIRRITGKG